MPNHVKFISYYDDYELKEPSISLVCRKNGSAFKIQPSLVFKVGYRASCGPTPLQMHSAISTIRSYPVI